MQRESQNRQADATRQVLSVSLPSEEAKGIRAAAERGSRSVSREIRRAIQGHLQNDKIPAGAPGLVESGGGQAAQHGE